MSSSPIIIVADTNVIINFLNINRLDLISKHSHQFIITDHVIDEIIKHKTIIQQAAKEGVVREVRLESDEEVKLFAKFESAERIGRGECSAIACAIYNGHKLAIDDKRAITEAKKASPNIEILKTEDLIISMISEQLLSAREADKIKALWESKHKFRLPFKSFASLVS